MSGYRGSAKKRFKYAHFAMRLIIGLEVMLLIAFMLQGKNFAPLNPKGFIAKEQFGLIVFSAALLCAVAIPTLLLLYFFAWKYRETNEKATYDPHTRRGNFFLVAVWGIPSIIMLVFASVMIPATRRLDPRQQISSDNKPITIQVVAMQWKWVFIYPEQHIATVNYVQIPTDTPVVFELSADEAPMSSFWIPNLGGQLYAMTGHMNTLHLMAEKPGDYNGSSAEINGAGFAGMKFIARASSTENFDQWVKNVKRSPDVLDSAAYKNLLKPSENNKAAFYSNAESDLFDNLLLKYNGAHHHTENK